MVTYMTDNAVVGILVAIGSKQTYFRIKNPTALGKVAKGTKLQIRGLGMLKVLRCDLYESDMNLGDFLICQRIDA